VPLLHGLLEGRPDEGVLMLGWVGYPYADYIINNSFVEGDAL
jgi:hypothetical protein